MTRAYEAIELGERGWNRRARLRVGVLRHQVAHKRTGLVISGGGSQGSFETGVLRFLYDHIRFTPVAICGNSVGAILSAKLAEGDDAKTGRRAIDEVEVIWRCMRANDDMWRPEPWFKKLQSSAAWATELREKVGEQGTNGTQIRIALRLLTGTLRHPPETDGTIDALRQALKAKSLLNLGPIKALLAAELHPDRILTSGIRLRLGTVSLESGELRYVTESGALHDRHDQPTGLAPIALAEGIIASASIPVVFPAVRLGDEHYVDGGAREILPLALAFHHLDTEQIFAVAASAPGVLPAPSFADKGLFDVARRVATEIGPAETLRKELYPPRGWGRRVTLIAPEFNVHDALTIDPGLIAISLDYGYMRAADVVLGLNDQLRQLTGEITRTRMDLRDLDGAIPSFLGAAPLRRVMAGDAAARRQALQRRLSELTEGRRDLGGPLPPSSTGGQETTSVPRPVSAVGRSGS
jgi:NTE family protein